MVLCGHTGDADNKDRAHPILEYSRRNLHRVLFLHKYDRFGDSSDEFYISIQVYYYVT